MVCKEEVITWFQNLQAHKRIEAMYMFLNMCYPLELRFCGTCLEDLARKDYYILRDKELEANNITEVSKIRNIHDQHVRNHLIIVLSLLNSSNTLCAKEIFRILSEEIKLDVLASLRIYSDSKLVEQYLLLLALAQHHPAFNFVQQTYLAELSTSIENCARELSQRTKYEYEERCSQPVYPYVNSIAEVSEKDVRDMCNSAQSYRNLPPVHRRVSEYHQNLGRIRSLKVKPPHRKQSIKIRVTWSNYKPTDTFKTPKELMGFHQKLLELYPNEIKGTTNQEKFIPMLPQPIIIASQVNDLSEPVIKALIEYIEQLNTRLPGYILESEFVTSFFLPSTHTRTALTKGNRSADVGQGDIHSRNSRLRSLTIYNSQMGDNSSGHRPECRQKIIHSSIPRKHSENGSCCGRMSPLTSPLQSPSSSPYASPISSETNSRAGSPWNSIAGPYFERNANNSVNDTPAIDKALVKDQIQEQWDTSRKIEEIQGLPIEELQALGILRDDKKRKVFDMKSPPNGIINTCMSKSLNSQKPSLLMQQPASNDSSPVCSEYSSPPQSPSPAEGCNQSTSLSSSNEENLDKRTIKTLPDLLKIEEADHSQNMYDSNFKRTDDDAVSLKGNLNRTTISVIPFPSHYSSIISQIPPQNMKPAYLPIPCRTNNAPQHLSPSAVVFDNPLRVPLPSALTYLQGPPRSHAVTPDRVLSSPNIPISSVSPFPVVTSGCATLPSATCCITSHKSSTVTVVTNSAVSSNRHAQKNPSMRDTDVKPVPQPGETAYASAFILSSTAQLTPASCSCFTTNSARPSPAPSPSMSPGATPQQSAVPVSLPYLGMPYVFHHHSIPFLTAQASANGFVPQPGLSNPGQSFGFAALNGLATLPPELVYPAQTFALQSPSTQGNPGQVASPGSQCYGAFPQTAAVPVKLMPSTSCYNCGKMGHRGADCKEPTMDDLNKTGKFQLNYTPIPKIPDE